MHSVQECKTTRDLTAKNCRELQILLKIAAKITKLNLSSFLNY